MTQSIQIRYVVVCRTHCYILIGQCKLVFFPHRKALHQRMHKFQWPNGLVDAERETHLNSEPVDFMKLTSVYYIWYSSSVFAVRIRKSDIENEQIEAARQLND